jgi:hypothetical protein
LLVFAHFLALVIGQTLLELCWQTEQTLLV